KGKKGKKGKKDKKKKKGLPGDKIAELREMDTDHMLFVLIENELVAQYRPIKLQDFIGDFDYLGSLHHQAELEKGNWQPPEPSYAQLRQAIMTYAILGNGSPGVSGFCFFLAACW